DLSESQIVRAAREQQAGVKKFDDDEDGRRVAKFGSFARAGSVGFVVITIPTEAASEALRALVRYAAGSVLAILVIALVAAFLFARSVGAPLGKLAHAAATVARGKFDAEVPKVKS